MKGTLDKVSAKVDKVIAFLEKTSPEEKRAIEAVEQRGAAAVVMVNNHSENASNRSLF